MQLVLETSDGDIAPFQTDGASSSSTAKPDYGVYVCGYLEGEHLQMLIDSGASVSIISRRVYDNLDSDIRPGLEHSSFSRFQLANGGFGEVEGQIEVDICLGQNHIKMPFLVANITDNIILSALQCKVDFGRKRVTCDEVNVPCYDMYNRLISCKVTVKRTVCAPPRCETHIPVVIHKRVSGVMFASWHQEDKHNCQTRPIGRFS